MYTLYVCSLIPNVILRNFPAIIKWNIQAVFASKSVYVYI